jgi:hypothetical protein
MFTKSLLFHLMRNSAGSLCVFLLPNIKPTFSATNAIITAPWCQGSEKGSQNGKDKRTTTACKTAEGASVSVLIPAREIELHVHI